MIGSSLSLKLFFEPASARFLEYRQNVLEKIAQVLKANLTPNCLDHVDRSDVYIDLHSPLLLNRCVEVSVEHDFLIIKSMPYVG